MKYFNIVALVSFLILAGCSAQKANHTTVKQSEFKILCYNIHHANPPSKPGLIDIDAIAKVILDSKADVIALQEVDKNTVRSGNLDQAKALAEKTGMNYHFFKAIDYDGGDYGLAILSRLPMKDVKLIPLPQKVVAEKRIVAQVTIQLGKQQVVIATTHMDATRSPENRNAQMEYIMELYKDTKSQVILCGDLNSVPKSDAIKLLDQHFKRTCIDNCAPSVPQIKPRALIDYIATKNINWPLLDYRVIEELYASDHRPISATFKIK